jgi:serine/threonine-protein kinase
LGHDLKHDRSVAIKVLRPELGDLLGRERFLREIAIASGLRHPSILPLFDSGSAGDFLYYVMPYVEGESLRQRLDREKQLPIEDTVAIAREICAALSHAHQHGVVHRDIKPGNILLSSGRVLVADFGIARAVSAVGVAELTTRGLALGTPEYMSPEQAGGQDGLDGRSDIYSLGCVVYEMLASEPPFTGRTAQAVMARHLREEPPSLRIVRSTVQPELQRAIETALAKVPADRFATAAHFIRALEAATRPVAWTRRRRSHLLAAAVLTLAGLAGARYLGVWRPPGRSHGEVPRIAVMYFDTRSQDSALRTLADGLTEDLIHELGGINAFRVVSRAGVRPYRDKETPFDSIVARLGVTTMIDGRVRRRGDTLEVSVDLIDATSGTNLDSVTVQRLFSDYTGLERELAQQVASTLRKRMGRDVRLRDAYGGTASQVAQELVLRARRARDDAEALLAATHPGDVASALASLKRADSLLERAAAADPRWLRPLLDRGWTAEERAGALTGRDRAEALETGLSFAEETVRRAPGNAEALHLRGSLRWGLVTLLEDAQPDSTRLAKAETDLRAALDRDSTLARAWATLSYLLWLKGSFAEAAITAQRALREDAYLTDAREIHLQLFFGALFLGEFHQAREWCRRGRVSAPDDWRFVECELTLLRHDLQARPNPDSAWALVRTLDRLLPWEKARAAGLTYHTIYRRIVAATVAARAGDPATGRAELARALQATARNPSLRLDLAYDEAFLRLTLGERDRAREVLDGLIRARPLLGPLLARDPLFADLRAVTRP